MHAPEPLTPVDWVSFQCAYDHGITAAARAYRMPLRAVTRRINTYLYLALPPLPVPPEEAADRAKQTEARIGAAMARLSGLWNDEFLPEIKRYLADWEALDLAGATPGDLVQHMDDRIAGTRRLYEIHMLIWFPFMTAMSAFDDLYRDLFGQDSAFDAFDAHRLLRGFDNKTVEGGRALWQLSRRALAVPAVRRILEQERAAAVPAALEQSREGRAFLADLHAFLTEWGQRGDRWGWSYPSWIEDPTPAIKSLKDYVGQPDRHLDAELAAQVAERERLTAATRERLQGYPQAVVERFEALLTAAQEAIVLTEDHAFWIDFCCMYQVRRVFVELGRRFAAAGVLDRSDDVFLLTPDEIRETAQALPRQERRPLAAARRAEMAYFRTITAPLALGTPPAGAPPTDPVNRAIGKFLGAPPPTADSAASVRGHAGSPGKARGPARVVRSLAEAGRLRAGDVLVTETTAPPWTPLFATAAAIVTDTGGVLSHCAVVAREYGIPAVVGTGVATATIRDGQLVEVDGDAGLVRVI
jgi:pyruvate,water dikinase